MTDAAKKQEISVGKISDFSVGQFKLVEVGNRQIGITLLKNGDIRAVNNYCPHKGAPICVGLVSGTSLPCNPGELIYGRDGEVLVCPWHGYEFDLVTGNEMFRERPLKLRMYPAAEHDGEIIVTI
jgi:nitrite reductase (NADH) small subunit